MENAMEPKEKKVLVIGAETYIGMHIAVASTTLGHPTFALPSVENADQIKEDVVTIIQKKGITLLQGSLYNNESLVQAISAVDVVISAVPYSKVPDESKILNAIKQTGNTIERFIPSGYGIDARRTCEVRQMKIGLQTYRDMMQLIEDSGVCYTYIVGNLLARKYLGRPENDSSLPLKCPLYGDGNMKVVFSAEEDIGKFTVITAFDQRTVNKTLYIICPENILTLNEVADMWEEKTGRKYSRRYVSEQVIRKRYEDEVEPELKAALAFVHACFIRGEQLDFPIDPSFGFTTTQLYPNVRHKTIREFLNRLLPSQEDT